MNSWLLDNWVVFVWITKRKKARIKNSYQKLTTAKVRGKKNVIFKTISIFQSLLANYSWKWFSHTHLQDREGAADKALRWASSVNPKDDIFMMKQNSLQDGWTEDEFLKLSRVLFTTRCMHLENDYHHRDKTTAERRKNRIRNVKYETDTFCYSCFCFLFHVIIWLALLSFTYL